MNFYDIPAGTKIIFDNPPVRHGKTRVWTLGKRDEYYPQRGRYLNHPSRYGNFITESEWLAWRGRIHKEKGLTPHQTIKALQQEIDALKNENEDLKMKVQLLEAGN